MCVHLKFNYKKATQALNYFANMEKGKINAMKAIKLVFFADRYHLRKFGRPITNDEYFAMKLGPVGSGVKDIAYFVADEEEKEYSTQFIEKAEDFYFRTIAPVDKNIFSISDEEALSFAYDTFGAYDEFTLARKISHDYPEWKKHEEAIKAGASRVNMDYFDFLEDLPEELNRCFEIDEEEMRDLKEQLRDLSKIHAF